MVTLGWRFIVVAIPAVALAIWDYAHFPSSATRDIAIAVIATAGTIGGILWSTQTQINRGDLP